MKDDGTLEMTLDLTDATKSNLFPMLGIAQHEVLGKKWLMRVVTHRDDHGVLGGVSVEIGRVKE